jgi:hypothetical protein
MNKDIAEKVLQYVIDHPEKHDQSMIMVQSPETCLSKINPVNDCGSQGCIAGWATVIGETGEWVEGIYCCSLQTALTALEIPFTASSPYAVGFDEEDVEANEFASTVFVASNEYAILNFKEMINKYGV